MAAGTARQGPQAIEQLETSEKLQQVLAGIRRARWNAASISAVSRAPSAARFPGGGCSHLKTVGYKLSAVRVCVEKDRVIVGLYRNPPDKVMVRCVDGKTEIRALDRTRSLLPMGPG
jgi:hypothetical protein